MAEVMVQPEEDASLVERFARALAPEQEEAPEPQPEHEEEAGSQPEAEGSEPQAEADEQVVDPDAPFIPIKYKVEGGEDREETLSINQLKSGYMMRQDYQRKTAEVARARDTLTAEVESQVSQERQNYVQGLQIAEQALLAMVVPELNGVDMEQLAQSDPSKAVLLQAKAHKLSQTIGAIRQQLAQAQQQAMQKMAEQSKRALSDPVSGIQGWGEQMYSQLMNEGGRAYGFTPDEVAAVVDHRMIRVLHDAYQYRQLKAAKPKDQGKPAPKVIKPGVSVGKGERAAEQVAQLRQKAQKTGKWQDAAEVYLASMRNRK